MNTIQQIQSIIANVTSASVGYINVKQYGAKGDGTTDDAKAISVALGLALAQNKDLYIPSGTYLLNSFWNLDGTANTTTGYLFYIGNGTSANYKKIRIFGDQGTKLTTSLIANGSSAYCTMFEPTYFTTDITFDGIFFENTHAVTTNPTIGIVFAAGTAGNFNFNSVIQNCRFEGFSTAVQLNGCVNPKVINNIFNAPTGRQCSTNNANPAVFVWLVTNDSAQVINVLIQGNYANGYSQSASITTTTQRALMDGFVFGCSLGANICNNFTKNFGTEHYICGGYTGSALITTPILIQDNVIDCTIPEGTWSYQSTTALLVVPGIRMEAPNAVVQNNTFYNVTQGILMYAASIATYQFNSWVVKNNTFYAYNGTVNSTYNFNYAILLQGYNGTGFQLLNPIVLGNVIIMDGTIMRVNVSLIQLNDAINCVVKDNVINIRNITKNGFTVYNVAATRTTNIQLINTVTNGVSNLTGKNLLSTSTLTETGSTDIT